MGTCSHECSRYSRYRNMTPQQVHSLLHTASSSLRDSQSGTIMTLVEGSLRKRGAGSNHENIGASTNACVTRCPSILPQQVQCAR